MTSHSSKLPTGSVREVTFEVPGAPVAKGRPRISTRGGKVRSFTPEKTVNFEGRVAFAAKEAMDGRDLMEGPISLRVTVCLPVPQSWSPRKQKDALANIIRPCSRPDIDNYVKSICDGANLIVWKDDSQVVWLQAAKIYSAMPGVVVTAKTA